MYISQNSKVSVAELLPPPEIDSVQIQPEKQTFVVQPVQVVMPNTLVDIYRQFEHLERKEFIKQLEKLGIEVETSDNFPI